MLILSLKMHLLQLTKDINYYIIIYIRGGIDKLSLRYLIFINCVFKV
jgi:hypothetical protein